MPLFGIDVSGATVDWAKVRASGIGFGIAKATEGNGYTQAQIATNLRGMRAAGLIPGAYHFLVTDRWGATGALQCDYFLSKVGDVSDLIVALDVERERTLDPYQPGIREVRSFAARFAQLHPNHPLLIYSGSWYWNSPINPDTRLHFYMDNPAGSDLGPLWDSFYVATYGSLAAIYATVPAFYWTQSLYGGWTTKTLLQFTSHPTVPGVTGNCDASAFRGTADELKRFLIDPSLPSTSTTEDSMTIITLDRTGYPRVATFVGGTVTGYSPDGTTVHATFAVGSTATCTGTASISQDPQKAPNGTFRLIGDGPLANHYVLTSTCTLGPATTQAVDCTSAVADAVAPLNTKIADLTTKLSNATSRITVIKGKVAATAADVADD